jgi:kynurenine formamidase
MDFTPPFYNVGLSLCGQAELGS